MDESGQFFKVRNDKGLVEKDKEAKKSKQRFTIVIFFNAREEKFEEPAVIWTYGIPRCLED